MVKATLIRPLGCRSSCKKWRVTEVCEADRREGFSSRSKPVIETIFSKWHFLIETAGYPL